MFVYGTLKRGLHNNHFLKNSKYIEDYVSTPKYSLHVFKGGIIPVLLHGDQSIHGEVWDVSDKDFPNIERLESGYYILQDMDGKYKVWMGRTDRIDSKWLEPIGEYPMKRAA